VLFAHFCAQKKRCPSAAPSLHFFEAFLSHTVRSLLSLFSLSLPQISSFALLCLSLSVCSDDRSEERGRLRVALWGGGKRESERETSSLCASRALEQEREREREKGSESTSDEREGREKEKSEKKQNSCATCCVKKKKERTHTKKSKNISVLICRDTRQRQSAE